MDRRAHRPGAPHRDTYQGILDRHIVPYLGESNLGHLTTATERRWHTKLHKEASPSATAKAYRVLLAAWCSLRLDELTALTRADLDLLHGKVKITKNLQRLDDGTLVVVKPKSEAGQRTVTIPPPLLPDVTAHLDAYVGAAPYAALRPGLTASQRLPGLLLPRAGPSWPRGGPRASPEH